MENNKYKSSVLINTKKNKILKCQTKPKGGGGLPSFKALCKSARVDVNDPNLKSINIEERMSTKQCINKYRVNNNSLEKKSELKIKFNKEELIIEEKGDNLIEEDDIRIKIENIEFDLHLSNSIAKKKIKFIDPGEYKIMCVTDKYTTTPIILEVR